jgi:hypothetical protein
MGLYCTNEFKTEIERLRKSSSYASVEDVIIEAYCNTTFNEWRTGDLLFAVPTDNPDALYLKKRLEGKGGYRTYGIAKVRAESFYLGYVHPKTGSAGRENITKDERKRVAKEILNAIRSNELLEVQINTDKAVKGKLKFIKKKIEEIITK